MGRVDFLKGLVAPLLTPFKKDKALDEKALEIFVQRLSSKNVNVLFPMGGSGEYETLALEERKRIIEVTLSACRGKIAVVPGTGGKSLRETIELSHYAQARGAYGVTIVIPDFLEPGEEAIFSYFHQIGADVDVPIMIYDPRGSGPRSVSPGLMKRMATELKKIAGIKYRTTDGEKMAYMMKEVGEITAVLSGVESVYLSHLAIGVAGLVGGGGNIYPNLLAEIYIRFAAGELTSAREAQFKVLEALRVLEEGGWPLSGKLALKALGIPYEPVTRVPAKPISKDQEKKILNYFVELNEHWG